jgi:phage baseplate assembly protein W
MATPNVTISFPFAIGNGGNVKTISSEESTNALRVRSVIGTLKGERVMRPTFGSDVSKRVFESYKELSSAIAEDVRLAFAQWLYGLSLIDVVVGALEFDGTIQVHIKYTAPTGDEISTTVGLVAVAGNAISREVLL